MSLKVHQLKYEQPPEGFLPGPILTITASGMHDVGRLIEVLAKGNVEHMEVARTVERRLRRTRSGKSTLLYLQKHGGGKWFRAPRLAGDAEKP